MHIILKHIGKWQIYYQFTTYKLLKCGYKEDWKDLMYRTVTNEEVLMKVNK